MLSFQTEIIDSFPDYPSEHRSGNNPRLRAAFCLFAPGAGRPARQRHPLVTVPNEKTGLLSYFRRVCAGPGEEGLVLSPEELEKLASEHDLILRSSSIDEH